MLNHVDDAEPTMTGVRFSVTFPEELLHTVQAYAAQEDRSRNKMIQLLLMEAHAHRQAAQQARTEPVPDDNPEPTA